MILLISCTYTSGQIYTGVNTVCTHKQNCSVAGHDCLPYRFGSKTFKVICAPTKGIAFGIWSRECVTYSILSVGKTNIA